MYSSVMFHINGLHSIRSAPCLCYCVATHWSKYHCYKQAPSRYDLRCFKTTLNPKTNWPVSCGSCSWPVEGTGRRCRSARRCWCCPRCRTASWVSAPSRACSWLAGSGSAWPLGDTAPPWPRPAGDPSPQPHSVPDNHNYFIMSAYHGSISNCEIFKLVDMLILH